MVANQVNPGAPGADRQFIRQAQGLKNRDQVVVTVGAPL
jgi:hypothetical protein